MGRQRVRMKYGRAELGRASVTMESNLYPCPGRLGTSTINLDQCPARLSTSTIHLYLCPEHPNVGNWWSGLDAVTNGEAISTDEKWAG